MTLQCHMLCGKCQLMRNNITTQNVINPYSYLLALMHFALIDLDAKCNNIEAWTHYSSICKYNLP